MQDKMIAFVQKVHSTLGGHLPGKNSVLSPADQHSFLALVSEGETLMTELAPVAKTLAAGTAAKPEPREATDAEIAADDRAQNAADEAKD
jgi:hypothetical protein